jgi:Skp family chaperone for outer membrane proteins
VVVRARRRPSRGESRRPGTDADPEKEFNVVNKSLACVAGALALAGSFFGSGRVAAQPPGTATGQPIRQTGATAPAPGAPPAVSAAAMPGTRVAVVNINMVLKNYQKAQSLNNSIKQEVQGYAQRMEQKKKQITELQAEMAKPTTTPQQREQMEKNILILNRELQDIDAEARKTIGKKQGDIAVMIFREIESVIQSVAKSNGFDLVLSYPDATTNEEMYSQDNVVRKLASQAAIPLFYKPHIDMTDAVIKTLNLSYPVTAAAPAAAPQR